MRSRSAFILILALLLGGAIGHAQENESQPKQSRLQAMQKEKARLIALRRKLVKANVSPREFYKQLNTAVAQGNYEQYKTNVALMARYNEYVEQAEKKHLEEKAKLYAKLAECHKYYAKQNEALVKAYQAYDSGALSKALDEIAKAEERILALGGKVSREWFLPSELEKVLLPGQEAPQPTNAATPKS